MLKLLSALMLHILLTLQGCDMKSDGSSTDREVFSSLIDTDLPFTSVRWEVFGSPEYTGGIPSRTEFMTLIAEMTQPEGKTFQSGARTGKVGIVPEAARPWLTEGFRLKLEKHKDSVVDVSALENCRIFRAKIRKSGRLLPGFVCYGPKKLLVYLTLFGEFDAADWNTETD